MCVYAHVCVCMWVYIYGSVCLYIYIYIFIYRERVRDFLGYMCVMYAYACVHDGRLNQPVFMCVETRD